MARGCAVLVGGAGYDQDKPFLPPGERVAEAGVDPARLVPYAIAAADGIAHRSDKQKVLASRLSLGEADD